MYKLGENSVKSCIQSAVPHIAQHIISKMENNKGFPDNPKAIDYVTKIVTLGLDAQTRYDIERELITASRMDYDVGMSQLKFIRSCMESVSFDTIEQFFENEEDAKEVWSVLNDTCHRDGCVFLRFIQDEDFKDSGICMKFAEQMGVVFSKFKKE